MKRKNKSFFEEEKESICDKCKLNTGCDSPKYPVKGKGKKKILIVLESPGKEEDLKDKHGPTTQLLDEELERKGINLYKDCWITFGVNCRPARSSRKPTKREIKCCSNILKERIKELKPKLIFLMGEIALASFMEKKLSETLGSITKWRGFSIPDQVAKSWVTLTHHPMYAEYMKYDTDKTIAKKIFRSDITKGLKKLKKKFPILKKYNIQLHLKSKTIIPVLRRIYQEQTPDLLAFDYETTGVKPYKKGHKIICVAIYDGITAHAFFLKKKRVIKLWKYILKNKFINKTAQNIKFEHIWTKRILKTTVKGWKLCTMQASHIEDNRSGITGLKFQSYINFGQEDYSSHLDKYMKKEGKKGFGFNDLESAPIEEVMKYCAIDTINQFKIAIKQIRKLK